MEVLLNLLKASVIVGCVVVALILLKPVLNRRYHAKWKYYVWLALALILLSPLVPLETDWLGAVEERAPIQIQVPQVEVTYAPGEGMVVQEAAPPSTAMTSAATTPTVPGSAAADQETQRETENRTMSVDAIFLWLWATGAVLFLTYHVLGTLVFYHRCRRWGRPAERAYVREGVVQMAQSLGIRREIPVWVTSAVDTPMMIGLVRPQLLLPTERYEERELGFILRHELTHLKRHDLWYKLALLAANAVHWFNPLAYLLVREANVDMELTCDDAVLTGADSQDRRAYSETLLASVHRQKGLQGAALSTHFYGGAEVMKERFRNILGDGRRKRGIVVLCVVLLLTVAAGCAVAFNSQKPEELTAEELTEWEEKLNSPEWNGFVTHMYSDVKYLSLHELLYNGAGISHEMTNGEVEAYLDAIDMLGISTDMEAIAAEALEDYLKEYTGLTLEDFASGLDWVYVEEYDTYYFQHGDTNFARVEVMSGTRTGNAVTLEIWAPGSWDAGVTAGTGANWNNGTLTITDGKVVSYCNDLYAAAETMALSALQELEDSYQEKLSISRSWVESLNVWGAFAGDLGNYYEWEGRLNLAPTDPEALADNFAGMELEGEILPYSYQLIVRQKPDGTIEQLESSWGVEGTTEDQFQYLGVSFSEYCRYHYDYGMELQGRQMGWPDADNRLVVSIQNGGDAWTQTAEDVARGWLMSWGDDLDHYEVAYAGTPDGELADQDQVLRVWSTGGRCVLLAMDHVKRDYGIGDWADTVAYWEVMGYNLESGSPLPQERLGQDFRSNPTTLDRTLNGETEQIPCFLYSGGGDCGLYAWSLYIPYEQWSCNYLANRWCPNQNDMSIYMEVRAHDADYTSEVFYDSYVQQFDSVWTNQNQYGQGNVGIAWALGLTGERYTESYLFTSGEQVYEVMWTYTAEGAEDWGTRMRWSADTFNIIGSTGPVGTGELKQVKPGETLVVKQTKDVDLIAAGTYLVLPDDSAYCLENYLEDELKRQLAALKYSEGTFGQPQVLSIVRQEMPADIGKTVELFRVTWGAKPAADAGLETEADGLWRFPQETWLVVEHNGEYVTRSFAMFDGDVRPGDEAFASSIQEILTGLRSDIPVTMHTTHPAIFYDRTAEKLYAVSTRPAQMAN